jgi:cytochrome c oxidase subunit 3
MQTPVLTPGRLPEKTEGDLGWSGGGGGVNEGGSGGGGWNSSGPAPADIALTGVWVAIIAIVMLFAALSGIMIARGGGSREWARIALPKIVYLNSIILLVSSLTLEFSRASLTACLPRRFLAWLYATLALGIGFIAGQVVLWSEIADRGIYLATDPGSSFFYLLTGAHALHLTGGIIALAVLVFQAKKIVYGRKRRTLLDATAVYWHFMYGLWMYILLLLVLKL